MHESLRVQVATIRIFILQMTKGLFLFGFQVEVLINGTVFCHFQYQPRLKLE